MVCPICCSTTRSAFRTLVLQKYEVDYDVCDACGFLFARDPHWLVEAYSSPIASLDTGLVMRNVTLAPRLASLLFWGMRERGSGVYLDAAGGYGMLTRLMRDLGFNFYWRDLYAQNLLARGFEYSQEVGPSRAVTAIEVLEHLANPIEFLSEILGETKAEALILTTELYTGKPPAPAAWWYYAFPGGQHIGFYQRRTLNVLGNRLGLHVASANGLHVLSKAPMNDHVLALLTNRWVAKLFPWWIRRRLGPKTWSDYEHILTRPRL